MVNKNKLNEAHERTNGYRMSGQDPWIENT